MDPTVKIFRRYDRQCSRSESRAVVKGMTRLCLFQEAIWRRQLFDGRSPAEAVEEKGRRKSQLQQHQPTDGEGAGTATRIA